jgi:hypothetical protein
MELLKWLDDHNKNLLLTTFNQWWEEKKRSGRTLLCENSKRLQKRRTDKAANYRPISLLSSFYKVYMILISQRLQKRVEHVPLNTASAQPKVLLMQST